MAPADDSALRSLNELRRFLLANDVSGVRRMLYVGDMEWMRQRLEPPDFFAVRDHVNSGDMSWLRERFLVSDARWLRSAVLEREDDALRVMGRVGGLDWLRAVIPPAHFAQLQPHLDAGDIDWVGERLAGWPLDETLPPATTIGPAPAAAADNNKALTRAAPPQAPADPPPLRPAEPRHTVVRRRAGRVFGFGLLALVLFGVALTALALYDSYRTRDTSSVATTATTSTAPITAPVSTVPATSTTAATTTRPAPTTVVVLTTDVVYFPADVTYIPQSANAVLDTAAAKIKANPGISVRLNGVADPSGSASANRVVSQKRAEAVQAALIARGVQANFEIVASGTDATVEPALARRVEIVYLR